MHVSIHKLTVSRLFGHTFIRGWLGDLGELRVNCVETFGGGLP